MIDPELVLLAFVVFGLVVAFVTGTLSGLLKTAYEFYRANDIVIPVVLVLGVYLYFKRKKSVFATNQKIPATASLRRALEEQNDPKYKALASEIEQFFDPLPDLPVWDDAIVSDKGLTVFNYIVRPDPALINEYGRLTVPVYLFVVLNSKLASAPLGDPVRVFGDTRSLKNELGVATLPTALSYLKGYTTTEEGMRYLQGLLSETTDRDQKAFLTASAFNAAAKTSGPQTPTINPTK